MILNTFRGTATAAADGADPPGSAPLRPTHMASRDVQRARVLRMLMERGERGINELRNHEGFTIIDAGWRFKFRVYVLVGDVEVNDPPRLFDAS